MKKYLIYIPIIALLCTCKLNTTNSDNSPPKINEIIASPSQPQSGQLVILNAIATDSDGDNLTYNWSVSAGQLEGEGIGNPIQWTAPNSSGEINIICVVSDGKDVDTKNITIITNYNYGILKGYIYDDYTKEALRASIYIEDKRVETADIGGYYEFDELEIGNHIINVKPSSGIYQTYLDTIEIISGENFLDIYIKRINVTYRAYIREDSTNINIDDAVVYVGSYIPNTNNNSYWQINFDGEEIGNTYNYQVSKVGYKTFNDSLNIIGKDTSFVTYLERE